jgi:hypothetical protein
LIRGKHSGDRGRHIGNDQREIAFLAFLRTFAGADSLDVAKDGRSFEAAGRADRARDYSKLFFQINPAVSS